METFRDFIPGIMMGITRAIISHPFEMLKLKSQISHPSPYSGLFKGLHYSIGSNALERGIQFGLFEKFKKNDTNLTAALKSSLISTSISLPYNIILLKKTIMKTSLTTPSSVLVKSMGLEYSRNLIGSTIFMTTYYQLKDSDFPIIIRAPLASCSTWLITYPLDSYKNLLLSGKPIDLKYIYRGIQYPLLRSFPSSIVGFYVYEYILHIIK